MKKLSQFLYRFSSGWVVLAALAVLLVFCVLTMPAETALTDIFSHGLGSPDTLFYYNSQQLVHMAEVYGESGRAAFLNQRWTFDLAFPLIYTFFFLTSISFLFSTSAKDFSRLPLVNLIPLMAFLFDLAENSATSAVMAEYPRLTPWIQMLATLFTPLKWIFVAICAILLLAGVILFTAKRLKQVKHLKGN
jgi:hypothetical protein